MRNEAFKISTEGAHINLPNGGRVSLTPEEEARKNAKAKVISIGGMKREARHLENANQFLIAINKLEQIKEELNPLRTFTIKQKTEKRKNAHLVVKENLGKEKDYGEDYKEYFNNIRRLDKEIQEIV